jgi:16S rRNA (uracil1498-N3)-methyltransferase
MHRFFVSCKSISANKIVISDNKQVHYLRDVLRLKVKDKVVAFDEQGNEFNCLIKKNLSGKIILDIKKTNPPASTQKRISLSLACAIPKRSNMDDIIDKLTQAGVDRIIPLKTKRVIVNFDEEKKRSRLERWCKIAQSAAQQAKRNTLPIIEPVKDIKKVILESKNYALKLIPTLTGERKTLKEVLQTHKPRSVLVFIGPEGDFTDEEVDLAKQSGFIPVTLGNLVLRVETAAVAVASFIRLYADR